MAKNEAKSSKDVRLWQKLVGIPLLVLYFFLWLIDRQLHVLLPHAKHPNIKDWLKDGSSFKMTITRIIIFAIPIIIYKFIW